MGWNIWARYNFDIFDTQAKVDFEWRAEMAGIEFHNKVRFQYSDTGPAEYKYVANGNSQEM